MMGFDVICTNPANKSSVKFCVDEVFEDRGGLDMRRKSEAKAVLGRQVLTTTPWLTERHGYDPT